MQDRPLLLRGGRVIDPASSTDHTADVLLANGRVVAIESTPGVLNANDAHELNVEGMIVAPGLVDPHVHLREPGGEAKETIATGTAAAVTGGFTTVCCMPNTTPAIDTLTTFDFIRLRAAETAACHVHIVAAATVSRAGEALAAIQDMARAGAVAFSDDGDGIASADMMRRVLQTCKGVDRTFMQHCQDVPLTVGASMHDGKVSASLGLVGWPRVAEELMLERDLRLNREIGCAYHAQHLSSGGSVEILRAARAAGVVATGEVSPHHLLLTDEACEGWNTNAKMNPPLRETADIQALREGVAEGVITVLATDHAPHTPHEKNVPFELAPFGIVGSETALPLYAEALIESGAIEWPRLIALMTIEPAKLCHLDERGVGTLCVGGPADVTVIDPTAQWMIDPDTFKSKSVNTPFGGRSVTGRAMLTIVSGGIRHSSLESVVAC